MHKAPPSYFGRAGPPRCPTQPSVPYGVVSGCFQEDPRGVCCVGRAEAANAEATKAGVTVVRWKRAFALRRAS